MKAMTDKAADWSCVHTRLDTIGMSELERRRADASLRQGELIAELVLHAAADMRAIAQFVEAAAAGLAGAVKALFVSHAKH